MAARTTTAEAAAADKIHNYQTSSLSWQQQNHTAADSLPSSITSIGGGSCASSGNSAITPATADTHRTSPRSALNATKIALEPIAGAATGSSIGNQHGSTIVDDNPSSVKSGSSPPTTSAPRGSSSSSGQADPWPLWSLQQASLYSAQLQHFANLISPGRGGGLQQAPQFATLPPTVAASSPSKSQPASRSRASSRVSNKDHPTARPANEKGHGNRSLHNKDKGDKAQTVTTGKDASPKMPQPKSNNKQQQQQQQGGESAHNSSGKPRAGGGGPKQFVQHQNHSNSMPSTPQQHPRHFNESRDPSPTNNHSSSNNQNHSPRSSYSETNSTLPSLRPLPPQQGCRFETAQINFRRRMPYNKGSGVLEKIESSKVKSRLSEQHERQLTTDMRELYNRLLPTDEVEKNRTKMCTKLEKIFNEEWPGNDIRVHLFGSSGNLLCSDDSDVDICITTSWKGMENTCRIAELLHRKGMEKVVCIAAAKVPIVKIWDPELELACDMNVNNTLALENTRMVRTYIEVDPRVRPLAMIVKYWTRKRILNDAAFGSTLSSYTWICLIIAFLQLRDPPILPALHQMPDKRLPKKVGQDNSFADDLDQLRGFGDKNQSTLGQLLFQFFRFYAHEFDYGKYYLSVRQGKKMPKSDKPWSHDLCVEEPFNTARNLGNTADEYSFRGLHTEIRRAFDLISDAKLDECCEQYEFPKEEPPPSFIRPPNAPRPVMIRSSSQHQQSGRGGGRNNYRGGGRHSTNHRNGGNPNNRRASASTGYDPSAYLAQQAGQLQLTASDYAWLAQMQQSLPQQQQASQQHSQGGQTAPQPIPYPSYQMFANSGMYQQMHAQMPYGTRLHGTSPPQASTQHQPPSSTQQGQHGSSERSRTNSIEAAPLSAPLPQDWYYWAGMPWPGFYQMGGFSSSPATASTPVTTSNEFRRSLQRSSNAADLGTTGSGSSLRSQSQPASRSAPTAQQIPPYSGSAPSANGVAGPRTQPHPVVSIPSFMPDQGDGEVHEMTVNQQPHTCISGSPGSDDGQGTYIGYYTTDASPPKRGQQAPPNCPSHGDPAPVPAQSTRRLSAEQQSLLDRRMKRASRSPSPLGHARNYSVGASSSTPMPSVPFPGGNSSRQAGRPLVVNGTGSSTLRTSTTSSPQQQTAPTQPNDSDVPSDNVAGVPPDVDNPLNIQGHGFSSHAAVPSQDAVVGVQGAPATSGPRPASMDRGAPVIVNGSTGKAPAPAVSSAPMPAVPQQLVEDASFRERIWNNHRAQQQQQQQQLAHDQSVDNNPWSNGRHKLPAGRQVQNGAIAPLDLALSQGWVNGSVPVPDSQHLSPINETQSPPPTTIRQGDPLVRAVDRMSLRATSQTSRDQTETGRPGKSAVEPKHTKGAGSGQHASRNGPAQNSPARSNGPRESGHIRGAKSDGHNTDSGSWQKAAKARRKGADNRNGGSPSQGSGEQPPQDVAERKGG